MAKPKHIQHRFRRLQEMGCVACRAEGLHSPPDIHHLVEGHKRLGDAYTIPLCPWHHRGIALGINTEDMLGPSLARNKRAFVQRFGSERELLEKVNQTLAEMDQRMAV